jgi:hypothetical protein
MTIDFQIIFKITIIISIILNILITKRFIKIHNQESELEITYLKSAMLIQGSIIFQVFYNTYNENKRYKCYIWALRISLISIFITYLLY